MWTIYSCWDSLLTWTWLFYLSQPEQTYCDSISPKTSKLVTPCQIILHCKVASTNTFHLEAHPGINRLLMKGKLDVYVLWLTVTFWGKNKVHIIWEGHKISYFWLVLLTTKVRWRFCKILWPSQDIWTLVPRVNTHRFMVFTYGNLKSCMII